MALACRAVLRLSHPAAASTRRSPVVLTCRSAANAPTGGSETSHDPGTPFSFERAPDEAPFFPELFQPGRRAVLLAVDPDLGGAVAALCWQNPPPSGTAVLAAGAMHAAGTAITECGSGSQRQEIEGASTPNGSSDGISTAGLGTTTGAEGDGATSAGQPALRSLPATATLQSAQLELFDMPLEVWKYGSRDKKQPDAAGLIAILRRYTSAMGAVADCHGGGVAAPIQPPVPKQKKEKSSSAVRKRRKKKGEAFEEEADSESPAVAAECEQQDSQQQAEQRGDQQDPPQPQPQPQQQQGEEPAVVRAIVEYSTPQFMSGKFAWYGLGFATGTLNSLLCAAGIPYERVPSTKWKTGMGLRKAGKEGSIALACHLLPTAAALLKRKKDHGRAEAMLMAAWGLGVRMQPIGGGGAAGDGADGGGSEVDEDELAFSD